MGGRGGSSGMRGSRSIEEMLSALNALPNFGNKDKRTKQYTMKFNPLYNNATNEESLQAQEIDFSIKGEDRDKGTVRNVDISKVATTQPWVNTSAMKNSIQNPGSHTYSTDTPVGVEYNGKIFLVDGNHRGVTAFLRGDKKLKVRIIN